MVDLTAEQRDILHQLLSDALFNTRLHGNKVHEARLVAIVAELRAVK